MMLTTNRALTGPGVINVSHVSVPLILKHYFGDITISIYKMGKLRAREVRNIF